MEMVITVLCEFCKKREATINKQECIVFNDCEGQILDIEPIIDGLCVWMCKECYENISVQQK
jgi:hypothetical protein